MKSLFIKGTEVTPQISFDEEVSTLSIHGRSIPANADETYRQLGEWLDALFQSHSCITKIDMNLDYFNTASHKHLAQMFTQISNNCNDTKVVWHYCIDDDEMKQVGEIFARIFNLNFEFISFED